MTTLKRRFVISSATVLTLLLAAVPSASAAANFVTEWGKAGTGDGQFDSPSDVATDATGNVYVTDSGNDRVQKFDSNGNLLTKWGGSGSAEGKFSRPYGLTVAPSGDVYVADTDNNRIQQFTPSGQFVRMWGWGVDNGTNAAQTCTLICQAGIPGTGVSQLSDPAAIAVDSAGNLYVGDFISDRIEKLSPAGARLAVYDLNSSPEGIEIAPGGTVYVSEYNDDVVVRLTPQLAYIGAFGDSGTGDGQFAQAPDVTLTSNGDAYVVDRMNNRLQKFTAAGTFLGKFGTAGTGPGQMAYPYGAATDCHGNVYVADSSNRIHKFNDSAAATCGSEPGPGSGTTPSGSTPATDSTAPIVSGLTTAKRVFRAGSASKAGGTTFSYNLSESANVAFSIERKATGRRVGAKCVKQTRKNRKAKRCTKFTKVASLSQPGATGANKLAFSGAIGHKSLRSGSYRAVVTAIDAAGNRSKSISVAFKVAVTKRH